jgi:hypothetical protein
MRRRLDRSIRLLIVLNIVAVASLLGFVVFDALQSSRLGIPAQLETVRPGSSDLVDMGIAHIPTTSSCLLCHETGGSGGLKPIPPLGHDIEGWERCLICHSNESLAKTAPGHEGIPENECLNCHDAAPDGPPITQPHAELGNDCISCHGDTAHLPSTMVGRDPEQCWLCHRPAASPPPERPHPLDAGIGCRTCHQASDVGGLPIDHALRGDDTCVLCHAIDPASPASGVLVPLGPPGG